MHPFRLACFVLIPLLASACPGGKDKRKDATEEVVVDKLPPPAAKLIVGGMDPSFAPPGVEVKAEVFGGGFERGAEVLFSGQPGGDVRFNDDSSLGVTVPSLVPGRYDVTVVNPDGSRATLRSGLTIQAPTGDKCQSVTVYFDFDSSGLSAPVREQLDRLGACVQGTGQSIVIQGHCDERGTTEYNLSLGQRRADGVLRYLAGLGVNPTKLAGVSYGEERPSVSGGDADAWAANRRAEILVSE